MTDDNVAWDELIVRELDGKANPAEIKTLFENKKIWRERLTIMYTKNDDALSKYKADMIGTSGLHKKRLLHGRGPLMAYKISMSERLAHLKKLIMEENRRDEAQESMETGGAPRTNGEQMVYLTAELLASSQRIEKLLEAR